MEVMTVKQLLDYKGLTEKPIIDKGILYPKTRLILFGRYKSLKSMLAIDAAFSISHGIPWFGFQTARSRVLVVQMEIPKPLFRDRIKKYCNGVSIPDNLYFINEPYLKLDRDYGMGRLEPALTTFQPQVLLIDPLYKVLSGNISDPYVAEQLQTNIDKLREKYNLSIIIIAHTRQRLINPQGLVIDMGADEIMGSSNWPNWADTIIRVKRDSPESDYIDLTFDAMRNAEEELLPMRAKFSRHNLHWQLVKAGGLDMVIG